MPDNQQEQNPGGEKPEVSRVEELEELMAEKETALGRKVAVIFFDDYNAKDAVVVGVYS